MDSVLQKKAWEKKLSQDSAMKPIFPQSPGHTSLVIRRAKRIVLETIISGMELTFRQDGTFDIYVDTDDYGGISIKLDLADRLKLINFLNKTTK